MEHEDYSAGDSAGPWPSFADLLSATTLLFLVLFTVIAVPAMQKAGEAQQRRSTLSRIEEVLKGSASDTRVRVTPAGDYLLITIAGDATFPVNQFDLGSLRADGKEILRRFGAFVQSDSLLPLIDQVQVVGHTSAEGSDEHNWRLSSERAATVAIFLIDSAGLPVCKISALGRGRYYPVDPARARTIGGIRPEDRRIEIEVRPRIPGDPQQKAREASCVDERATR